MGKIRNLIGLLFFAFCCLIPFRVHASDVYSSLRALPVQDGGRTKPFHTLAKESVELIYGKDEIAGRPAVEVVMTWILQPTAWQDREIFEVRNSLVRRGLKLPEGRRHYRLAELVSNERLSLLMQDLAARRETKIKLDPYYQALQRLETQIFVFREFASGRFLRLVPPETGDAWLSLADLQGESAQAFLEITKIFVQNLARQSSHLKPSNTSSESNDYSAPRDSTESLSNPSDGSGPEVVAGTSEVASKPQVSPPVASSDLLSEAGSAQVSESELALAMEKAVTRFEEIARAARPDQYPSQSMINLEIHYKDLHPFGWSSGFYLLALLSLLLMFVFPKAQWLYRLAWIFGFVGLAMNVYGFYLRTQLTGRAPVTNMYETVVWVGFGAMVFAMILERIYRWRYMLMAGSIVAAFCLLLADMAPTVLDPSLQPLEPVLRSNFWLVTHVMTITISYAAFFLAFALGDISLIYHLRGEEKFQPKIKALTLGMYRSIQIGLAFLGPGIILGGVWADYSWGRFWGWDPKETWAFIAFMGYLAVLHARLVGWVQDFAMAACSVVTFSLVIMAWYGVNFVLGAGLHSYGFGAGGVEYVSVFVAAHIVFVIFAGVLIRSRKQQPQVH